MDHGSIEIFHKWRPTVKTVANSLLSNRRIVVVIESKTLWISFDLVPDQDPGQVEDAERVSPSGPRHSQGLGLRRQRRYRVLRVRK